LVIFVEHLLKSISIDHLTLAGASAGGLVEKPRGQGIIPAEKSLPAIE
jgi:hypothetical protein